MNVNEYLQEKLLPRKQLAKKVHELKNSGKTIATLNGSFDLLHAGHLHMIFEASKQADVLIVALNSDQSIKQYKSLKRPIVPLKERMAMMAALEFVDYVTSFDEINPIALLEETKPDVHVNGAEYGEDCLEAATVKAGGGRIHIVDLIPGLSTTNLLEKIVQCV